MLDFLILLQSFENPFLTGVLKIISEIITPLPLSLIAIVVYLSINKRKGIILALTVISSVTLNSAVKLIFRVQRPFLLNDEIKRLDDTEGFSFPSGHTQQASGMGFLIGKEKKPLWGVALWLIITLLMALSRMYLGMHSPLDVFVGAVLGILVTVLMCKLYDLAEKMNCPIILHAVTLFSLIAMFASKLDDDILTMAALSLGAITGYIIDEKAIFYKVPETLGKKALAALLGVIIIGLFKYLLSLIVPDIRYLRFLEYTAFGLSITAVAPYIIKKIIH